MLLGVNLRHLEHQDVTLSGELPVEALDIESQDEAIHVGDPLHYFIAVQRLEDGLLLDGHLRLVLDCCCVRCLKSFRYCLNLESWTCHVPLRGEDAAPVNNDLVDLTPYVREDILLEFPQHPLCDQDCRGLPVQNAGSGKQTGGSADPEAGTSPWSELNKLKF